jgi:hypothetical protein
MSLGVVVASAWLWSGCAKPSVSLTAQVTDANGNNKGQVTVTDSSSGPAIFSVAQGDQVSVTVNATDKYGLQVLSMNGDTSCTVCPAGSPYCTLQQGTLLAPPPTGNAIAPGTTPLNSSFTANLGPVQCNGPFEMDLNGTATDIGSPGLFGTSAFSSGPTTSNTQTAILKTGNVAMMMHKK